MKTTMTPDHLSGELRALAASPVMARSRQSLTQLADDLGDAQRLVRWSGIDLRQHFAPPLQDQRRSRSVRVIDGVRSPLIFMPIAVTWLGIWDASNAHDQLRIDDPEQAARPFLPLWQEGFDGLSIVTLGQIALVDATLIALAVILTFFLSIADESQQRKAAKLSDRVHLALSEVELVIAPIALRSQEGVQEAFSRALGSLMQLDEAARVLAGLGSQVEAIQVASVAINSAADQVLRSTIQVEATMTGMKEAITDGSGSARTFLQKWDETSRNMAVSLDDTASGIASSAKDFSSLTQGLADTLAELGHTGQSADGALKSQAELLQQAAESAQATSMTIVDLRENTALLSEALTTSAEALNGPGMDMTAELAQSTSEMRELSVKQQEVLENVTRLANTVAVAVREIREDAAHLRSAASPHVDESSK